MTCRIDTSWTYHGLECWRVENRWLALELLPDRGANIFRLIDKTHDVDVLWKNPRVRPHRAALHGNFDDHWAGGWDEAFPGGAPSRDRYGAVLPYMGELWSESATLEVHEATAERVIVSAAIDTPITTARFERRLTIEAGERMIWLEYRIRNTGTMPFDFNWGIHPSLAITPGFRFDVPAGRAEVDEAGGALLGKTGATYTWPYLGDVDMRLAMPASSGAFALHYLTELREGWFAATDTATGRGFAVQFDQTVLPVVWFVPGYGGFRGFYQALLEPWTGYPTALADAVEAGTARQLAAGDEFATAVRASLYDGVHSEVTGVAADGTIATGSLAGAAR